MDIVYVLIIVGFLLLTLALVAGCAALERKKWPGLTRWAAPLRSHCWSTWWSRCFAPRIC